MLDLVDETNSGGIVMDYNRRDFLRGTVALGLTLPSLSLIDILWKPGEEIETSEDQKELRSLEEDIGGNKDWRSLPRSGGMVCIEGRRGSGTTLTAVALAYGAYKEKKTIYSNIPLNFPYKKFKVLGESGWPEISNSCLLLVESYLYTDLRSPSRQANELIIYLIIQSRMRGNSVLLPTHQFDMLDKRLKRSTSTILRCRKSTREGKPIFYFHGLDYQTGIRFKGSISDPEKYFPLYNTFEAFHGPSSNS